MEAPPPIQEYGGFTPYEIAAATALRGLVLALVAVVHRISLYIEDIEKSQTDEYIGELTKKERP